MLLGIHNTRGGCLPGHTRPGPLDLQCKDVKKPLSYSASPRPHPHTFYPASAPPARAWCRARTSRSRCPTLAPSRRTPSAPGWWTTLASSSARRRGAWGSLCVCRGEGQGAAWGGVVAARAGPEPQPPPPAPHTYTGPAGGDGRRRQEAVRRKGGRAPRAAQGGAGRGGQAHAVALAEGCGARARFCVFVSARALFACYGRRRLWRPPSQGAPLRAPSTPRHTPVTPSPPQSMLSTTSSRCSAWWTRATTT